MRKLRAGFTLIELLVVIALIAVLAGVLGLALGRGNSGTALQAGQSTTSALVAGARAKAATSLLNAAVLINVTPSSDGFLRELRVATTADNGVTWIDTGESGELPNGIYLVPANAAFTTTNVEFSGANPAWGGNYYSAAFSGGPHDIKSTDGSTNITSDQYHVVAGFTPRGTTANGTLTRVVLAPAERVSADKLNFNNAAALRGMTISNYGIPTLINEPAAF